MTEDELLDELGQEARRQWSEATASLRPGDQPQWSPLTESEQAALVAGALARLDRESAAPDRTGAERVAAQGQREAAEKPAAGGPTVTDPVEPAANERPGTLTRVVAAAGLVLVAAAVLLLWRAQAPQVPGLPGYTDDFSGGIQQVRSSAEPAAGEVPILEPEAELRWVLRPQTEVEGGVDVRILAEGPARRCLSVTQGKRIARRGSIELAGPVGPMLGLEPGEWTLTAIVGRVEALSALDDACDWRAEGRSPPEGVREAGVHRVVVRSGG